MAKLPVDQDVRFADVAFEDEWIVFPWEDPVRARADRDAYLASLKC